MNQEHLSNNPNNKDNPKEKFPAVSFKSPKSELWNVYKDLLKKYEKDIRERGIDQPKKLIEEQKLKKVENYTVDNIVESLHKLKLDINGVVDALAQKLTDEARKMSQIQEAVKIQQQKIKELYDIEAAAESLEALVKLQRTKKEEFDLEYERIKQYREREREEYDYNLKQARKKEQVSYQEKLEEFKKREEELKAEEKELNELREKVEEFPDKLEQSIKETEEKTSAQVKKEMQAKADLLAKEVEGEKKVLETKLKYYEDEINKQNEQIESLKQNLDQATRQVQQIAEKALDSSSGKQTLKAINEIAMHEARRPRGESERR